jgi:hypothetical protein
MEDMVRIQGAFALAQQIPLRRVYYQPHDILAYVTAAVLPADGNDLPPKTWIRF